MKVKALISFSGKMTMYAGEICEITDKDILADLLDANYIQIISEKLKQKGQKETENQENTEQQGQNGTENQENTEQQ